MRLASALSAIAFAAVAMPAMAQSPNPSLTVQGIGEVRAAPDLAVIATGVTTQAETAREALDLNSAAMEELIAVLTEAGIAERDIQTSNFSVNPLYTYSDQPDAEGYRQPPRIAGYEVANSVTITVRDLDLLGGVLDQAVTVGANTIGGISFSLDDSTAALEAARRQAVQDAIAKAETYADAAGVELGAITSIREGQDAAPPRPMVRAEAYAMDAASSVPIQGGELTYSVTTTITWALETAE